MVLSRPIAATALALWPVLASGQASEWQRYVVAESGAAVDVPRDVFEDHAGKPETGYGARFLTTDRRANLTVQSVRNDANDTPAAFGQEPSAPRHRLSKGHIQLFCGLQLSQRAYLVRPLHFCWAVHHLRIDQLPRE